MQRWSICAAIALMVGCTDTASSASSALPEASAPVLTNPRSIARNCLVDRGVDYPAYVQTIDILRRSGEI